MISFRPLPALHRLLKLVVMSYVVLLVGMFFFQRHLIYHPTADSRSPADYGLQQFDTIFLTAEDGIKLQTWYRPAKPGWPTVFYFQGNAYPLGNRAKRFAGLAERGFGVFALSYRGFGMSGGKPTEQGLYRDARAVLAYAKNVLALPPQKIIFYGESLGTAIATYAATLTHPAALVLEAPFTSVLARASDLYFYLPVGLLLEDRFDTLSRIDAIHAPLLVLHGTKDEVIPFHYGEALFAEAEAPKRMITIEGGTHIDIPAADVVTYVTDFAREQSVIEDSSPKMK